MNFLGMGPAELLLVLALALIVFGPDKLPDVARQIGKTVGDLRRVSSDVTREIQRSIHEDPAPPGPRIVRQSPPPGQQTPPAASAPQSSAFTPASAPPPEPTILPPSNGGIPTPPERNVVTPDSADERAATVPPANGSWEDTSSQPAAERGPEPRRPI